MRIVVFGGYGFIGHNLINKMLQDRQITHIRVAVYGDDISIPYREYFNNPHNYTKSNIEIQIISYNPHKQESIKNAIKGMDLVINFIGILNQTKDHNLQSMITNFFSFTKKKNTGNGYTNTGPNKKTFEFTHKQIPSFITTACAANYASDKIKHPFLIHISAQGANKDSNCIYLQTKGQGEDAISSANINYTIIKPALVIGQGADFIRKICKAACLTYLMPLPVGYAKLQPIALEDLLGLIIKVIHKSGESDVFNCQKLNAVGPQEMTLQQLASIIIKYSLDKKLIILSLPKSLSKIVAIMVEWFMENPIISKDNILATEEYKKIDKKNNHAFAELGKLQSIEEVLRVYTPPSP